MAEGVFLFPVHRAAGQTCLSTPGDVCAVPHPTQELLWEGIHLFPAHLTSTPPNQGQEKTLNCIL